MPSSLLGPDGQPIGLGGYDLGDSAADLTAGMIVNQSGLPDGAVEHAVATHLVENSALNFSRQTTFQTYANNNGSLLARAQFKTPSNVFEEIKLSRDLAERDDDVGSTIGAMIALAFGDGMQNTHGDEVTVALYDEIAKHMGLDSVWKEFYREYLISGQMNSVDLFTRESFSFLPEGSDRYRTRGVTAPLSGVLPAEYIRVLDNDIFGTGTLAYLPEDDSLDRWLKEKFNPRTSPGRLAEMRREDPVAFAMFTELIQVPITHPDESVAGMTVYKLNPRMVHRTTMPKGAWKYPRPPITRNFPLLEAKRLLNIMDYALLQGGANFLVVAKKGTDDRPALAPEIENLKEVVRRASHTGVIVGDHRLDIDIITPDLKELLAPEKRKLVGRKLAMALLRLPEHMTENSGSEGMKAEVELMTRVITSDRRDIRRHVERYTYEEAAKRNTGTFPQGPAKIWFPKIILQGTQYFTDYILKMRDRGDISRRAAVEAGGFDYAAQVEQRKREMEAGHDEIMVPGSVPFSSPDSGPQDNNPGRPPGTSPGNGPNNPSTPPAPARPQRTIRQVPGETIKAVYDEALGRVVRVGTLTEAIMDEFKDSITMGRVRKLERLAVEEGETTQRGPLIVVPVNPELESDELQAVRLDDFTSLIVATRRHDGAKLTKAIVFKEPFWTLTEAEDRVTRWGFDVELQEPTATAPGESAEEETGASIGGQPINIVIEGGSGEAKVKRVIRDEHGQIEEVREVPAEEPEGE